jgi:hypothetical protein
MTGGAPDTAVGDFSAAFGAADVKLDHRPATIQRIRIGATKAGEITAIGHEKGRVISPAASQRQVCDFRGSSTRAPTG